MKFAQVGYGHDGRGGEKKGGYTYLVNDNVRTGDNLTPVVKHAGNGNVFVTVGKVLTNKQLAEAKQKALDSNQEPPAYSRGLSKQFQGGSTYISGGKLTQDMLTRAYSSGELNIQKTVLQGGKLVNLGKASTTLQRQQQSLSVYNAEQLQKGSTPNYTQGKASTTQTALGYKVPKGEQQ